MITVRVAHQGDVETIAAIHRRSILHLCAGEYSPAQLRAWTAALVSDGYAVLLQCADVFVAEDTEVLGFGALDGQRPLIRATYVDPGAVGRGVGRLLMLAMERRAAERGASLLELHATLNAVPFYARLGYQCLGSSTNRLPGGAELPCVLMQKRLGAPAACLAGPARDAS